MSLALGCSSSFFPVLPHEAGRRAVAFDVRYDNVFMDFNSDCGYCHAIYQVLRLLPGAGLMLAPVCSSWVFMNLDCR